MHTEEDGGGQGTIRASPRREASLGFTDLDVLASRLEQDGDHYEALAALGEFLGPAVETRATAEEIAELPVAKVELVSRRRTKDGKIKQKLSVTGLRVDRCTICQMQFRPDQMACIFPCLHIFHDSCASRLLKTVRTCPHCRRDIAEPSSPRILEGVV
ncbi:hypothetical protein K437DRAFT_221375 [Tilletiaria anomala UBC 951]|uniref:RING-type domain-containing protein n=1 Tax=Tilletiaria anomala (strain ATCC 24038 / CBS 436.72 / UBC 951) TaxID=1037660 RepID=A0A066WMV8_TILAU|nr:uncharacterized protein K437DRAFT_221375 [Tilletiaria anomala UBC 951]KDN51965.1 hypothetical protein K437DRAFT_221375 [Tilletiaria anomala UBC 951]